MNNPNRTKVIKKFQEILEELRVVYKLCFLFGSRATNSFQKDSDWDFFIVLANELSLEKKRDLKANLRMKFHEIFPVSSIDIIIKSSAEFDYEKNLKNTLSYEVVKKGIAA